eukprot:FR735244.1.p1 GENE.FR735244.1~~FR735244.1.p1  ORF type:complete len:124 (+),score=4.41 FR735244.1:122-493(+)
MANLHRRLQFERGCRTCWRQRIAIYNLKGFARVITNRTPFYHFLITFSASPPSTWDQHLALCCLRVTHLIRARQQDQHLQQQFSTSISSRSISSSSSSINVDISIDISAGISAASALAAAPQK